MSDKKRTPEEIKMAASEGIDTQPDPVPTDAVSSHDLVILDLAKRKNFGFKKYGTLLQAGNGRDALQDAYEEALDLCVYLRTAIEERNRES